MRLNDFAPEEKEIVNEFLFGSKAAGNRVVKKEIKRLKKAWNTWIGRIGKEGIKNLTPDQIKRFFHSYRYGKSGSDVVDVFADAADISSPADSSAEAPTSTDSDSADAPDKSSEELENQRTLQKIEQRLGGLAHQKITREALHKIQLQAAKAGADDSWVHGVLARKRITIESVDLLEFFAKPEDPAALAVYQDIGKVIDRVVRKAAADNPEAFVQLAQSPSRAPSSGSTGSSPSDNVRWSSGPFGQLGRSITQKKDREDDRPASSSGRSSSTPVSRLDLPRQHQRHIESALRAAAEKRTPSRDQHEAIQALLDRYFPAQ